MVLHLPLEMCSAKLKERLTMYSAATIEFEFSGSNQKERIQFDLKTIIYSKISLTRLEKFLKKQKIKVHNGGSSGVM